ncbi:gluconate 2-dehydrogenase subunit 3 family protein [Burkholderia vietnamiensis]|uniref:gluconate 2-dehydrogenase subunit 3 family protein n=1 Tax=Burkholderia vietnamiensis TaxID=60552 RepID=UPI001B9A4615|nr:gluconate 2-dehydrogenase subunit 3 family protein [Burkholderia vietnamiensis]MBR8218043.1 gluconate 2-dehydrogenase subunit 3 family protein [Burkholderia vietnamiensis]MCA8012908.1 gluconate 2-dehydrogenase subunit 3 family protein [Burkholderia vietnamiensis]MCA8446278.1 gluconate 2-dehydrogenase subunit 3 family protein [Burkholderia vietnamiensis]CAG9207071.1 Gluconate 2-dehydrogenase subunit 3 [Burkholderia vietnamiensis]HDR8942108.1 gluconate 2-dehydrogenase subunit 3 family protein
MSTPTDTSNSRRRFLRTSVALVPIASVAGCDLRSPPSSGSPSGAASAASASAERTPYKPTFFDAKEWAFVQAAVDRLIPADAEGPGALETGVPEFIDRQMETPYAHGATWYMQGPFQQGVPELGYQLKLVPRDIYRLGIAAVNRYCEKAHGKAFADLDAPTRDSVLGALEKGATPIDDVPSAVFFGQLLQNTREGYFCDPVHGGNRDMAAWKMIGFPGARADFMDFVNQNGKPYPYGPVSINGERT